MPVALPTKPATREGLSPLRARVFLAGQRKIGKTTFASNWAPNKTLLIDTQKGTKLLDGEHFKLHINTGETDPWLEFEQAVHQLCTTDHGFECVVLDLVDDLWRFCDQKHAGKDKTLATATDDYGRSGKQAEGDFIRVIAKLLATDLGVWFVSHVKAVENGGQLNYVPKLEPRVLDYVAGATDFVFLAVTRGPRRVLLTSPSEQFGAGRRVLLPDEMELDAKELFKAMQAGLNGGNK